jgi:RNA polymerase sigma-70 factor, ECF subfamily
MPSQPPTPEDFSAVVREHHSGLRYFIRSLGVQSAWVDDLAQEAFLVAYRKWEVLDDPANAGLWLRSIARHLVLNETSKRNRRQRLLDENITTLLLAAEPNFPEGGSLADKDHEHSALRACLQLLTANTLRIVEERYFKDRNSTEIAAKFALQPAGVRKILHRARQVLAECLQRHSITTAG